MTLDSPGPIRPAPPRRAHTRGRASATRPPAPARVPGRHATGAGPARTVVEWRTSGRLGALLLLALVLGGCAAAIYLGLISQPTP